MHGSLDIMKPTISPREEQLLRLVRQGFTNREIARRLDVREQTIKNALAVLFQKCHVRNRTQLAFATPEVRRKNSVGGPDSATGRAEDP